MPPEPERRSTVLRVVGAVIVRDGRVLCALRGTGALAGLWEFPGGKVEDGEQPRTALVREIEEELGCRIVVGAELTTAAHDYPFGTVVMTTYRCRLASGEPVASEHEELRWLAPSDLAGLEWAPVDLPTVGLLAG
ncbi:MAG: (deoxy)nucleoside triphosphate pyrophosphohydrolase [Propionicimonas sp.]|nr:(deoxy)nucleoside triphosphate pyrophosphohydrolase [Propionicimonas sp.]